MTGDQEAGREPAMRWGAVGTGVVVVAVVAAVVWSWPLKSVATGFQLLGVVLSALGVGVVRGWLKQSWWHLVSATVTAKHRLARSWALHRQRLRLWWLRRRGRTTPAYISGTSHGTSGAGGNLTVARARVDRQTISDREWLVFLDDRVELVFQRLDEARNALHEDLVRRLDRQREELRAEVDYVSRQGWELIVSGLACSAVGTVLGGLA